MSTKVITIPLAQWSTFDKSGWTPALIRKWNQRHGHMKKIPRAGARVSTAYLNPSEQRRIAKDRKNDRKKPLEYSASLDWDEVPNRLPYVFGKSPPKWFEELAKAKGYAIDESVVYVDSSFLEMVSKAVKVEQMKLRLAKA